VEAWRERLAAGDSAGAWGMFIARYRRLIIAVIRRTIPDDDDVDDVFGEVCADLSADDLALPARHIDSGRARLSTWLVTVVHHRTIDWIRHREGRRRVKAPPGLSKLQQQIFDSLMIQHRSHIEAYEHIRQRSDVNMSFPAFMKEVSSTFASIERATGNSATHYFPGPPPPIQQIEPEAFDKLVTSELAAKLETALRILPPDERLAVQLFVVDSLPAAAVARTVGWPNSKAVYNRVYRALEVLRRELDSQGLEQDRD